MARAYVCLAFWILPNQQERLNRPAVPIVKAADCFEGADRPNDDQRAVARTS